MLLSEAAGDGPLRPDGLPNGGLNRHYQRNARFETYRVLEFPWLKDHANAPAWATRVGRMTYQGVQRLMDNPGGGVPVRGRKAVP